MPRRQGLLLLAADPAELERQERLAAERQGGGIPLELWNRSRLEPLQPALPARALGGLHSPRDGQLDPTAARAALLGSAAAAGLEMRRERALRLERGPGHGWEVWSESGRLQAEWVVLAAGLASAELLRDSPALEGLAQDITLEPVLGQALELQAGEAEAAALAEHGSWPGAVSWRGMNLVPRPDRGRGHLWLGATLEPGAQADIGQLERLRQLEGEAPPWLRQARTLKQWQGCRCRPVGRPAPLQEAMAEGVLLLSGHYRNGVLLAAASAEWAAERIAQG